MEQIVYHPIGIIENDFQKRDDPKKDEEHFDSPQGLLTERIPDYSPKDAFSN